MLLGELGCLLGGGRWRSSFGWRGDEVTIKFEVAEGFAGGAVVAAEPVEELEEGFVEVEGVFGGDGAVVVDGEVTEFLDEADFWEETLAEVFFEGLFVDEGSEALVVGELEVVVVVVEPDDSLF